MLLLERHAERRREDMELVEMQERTALQRAGTVASAVMNAAGGKRGGGAYRPSDFFPVLRKTEKREQAPEEIAATLSAIFGRPPSVRA